MTNKVLIANFNYKIQQILALIKIVKDHGADNIYDVNTLYEISEIVIEALVDAATLNSKSKS